MFARSDKSPFQICRTANVLPSRSVLITRPTNTATASSYACRKTRARRSSDTSTQEHASLDLGDISEKTAARIATAVSECRPRRRLMKRFIIGIVALFTVGVSQTAFAQNQAPPGIAFDIPKADIDFVLKNAPPSP